MHQVLDYLSKIHTLLANSARIVSYGLQTFYTALHSLTLGIKEKDISLELINNYANIYKYLRNYLGQAVEVGREYERILPDLKKFINPLKKYLLNDQLTVLIIKNFQQPQTYLQVNQLYIKTKKIIQQLQNTNKGLHISANTQITISFWISQFKADYVVHFSLFWQALGRLTNHLTFLKRFINDSTCRAIREIVDNDRKYYVSMTSANDLFIKLTHPKFLQTLAELTSLCIHQLPFESTNSIQLKFQNKTHITTKLNSGDILIINGNYITTPQQLKKCKYPPSIRFGSSKENQIEIKNQFISRKQFMINQQDQGFFIICLSPSNFTSITYPYPIQLQPGSLFRVGKDIVQILKISTNFQIEQIHPTQPFTMTEYENTLQILPQNNSIIGSKEVEYEILTGQRKDQKGTLNNYDNMIEIGDTAINITCDSQSFHLPSNTPMLIKNSNQILSGHVSQKILLRSGMRIILQQCIFTVL